MKTRLRAAAAASLAIIAGVTTLSGPAGAATPSACAVMPAAQASTILGTAVTTLPRSNPASIGSSACMYVAGRHAIAQLNIMVHENEAAAEAHFKSQQQGPSHPNFVVRQKGNLLITDVTMNRDPSKLVALLDAAVKNL